MRSNNSQMDCEKSGSSERISHMILLKKCDAILPKTLNDLAKYTSLCLSLIDSFDLRYSEMGHVISSTFLLIIKINSHSLAYYVLLSSFSTYECSSSTHLHTASKIISFWVSLQEIIDSVRLSTPKVVFRLSTMKRTNRVHGSSLVLLKSILDFT